MKCLTRRGVAFLTHCLLVRSVQTVNVKAICLEVPDASQVLSTCIGAKLGQQTP